MQVKVYINDKFYKTLDTGSKTEYNPSMIMPSINADKEAGLLDSFNIQEQMKLSFEPQ